MVEKAGHNFRGDEEKKWGDVIARIELGKCYDFSGWMTNQPETDCYIYADDGNTRIEEDCYGKPLTETTVEKALKKLTDIMEKDDYRRYQVAVAVLNALVEHQDQWRTLAVLHYGY